MTREELLKIAKPMMVNLEVAKTIPNKTQTRRVVNVPIGFNVESFSTALDDNYNVVEARFDDYDNDEVIFIKPKWKAGNILWVREPVEITAISDTGNYGGSYQDGVYIDFKYASDSKEVFNFELSSEFWMKSWVKVGNRISNSCLKEMARTFLRVTNVMVGQLQDINYDCIIAEGFVSKLIVMSKREAKDWWINLWNKTAPKGYKWENNPYVFVYEFEKVEVLG